VRLLSVFGPLKSFHTYEVILVIVKILDTIMYILFAERCPVCACTAYVIFMTLDPSATPARLEATSFPSEFLRL